MIPKVSVVIPFYSNLQWLDEALYSVYNQTYQNIEIIVINDGSSEDIADIRKKYTKDIIFIAQENQGAAAARNKGIDTATGEYIAFLDSDDIWCDDKLSKQIKYMQDQDLKWSHSDYARFEKDSDVIERVKCNINGDIVPKCFVWNPIATPCVVIARDLLIQNKDLRFQNDKIIGEDTHLWEELGKNYKLGYIPEILTKVRMHGKNVAFQARLQLKYRGESLVNVKKHRSYFKSKFIYLYFISCLIYCKFSYKVAFSLKSSLKINDKYFEIFCKVLYGFPYMNFKIIKKII